MSTMSRRKPVSDSEQFDVSDAPVMSTVATLH